MPLPAHSVDGSVLDLSTVFDENGNVAAITDNTSSARQTRSMTYDGLDRLTQTSSPMFGAASYAYDPQDNLTRVQVTGGSQPRDHYYCYNATNQLAFVRSGPNCSGTTSPAVIALAYDVQGNLANKNGVSYAFDYGNRLRSTANQNYRYDAQGRRVRQDVAGSQLQYSQYATDGRLVWQRDETTNQRIANAYLAGSLLAEISRPLTGNTTTIRYLHTDALGSPIAKTSATGAIIETSEYEPYGRLLNRPNDNRAGYTGHVMDAVSGLTYMQQRYYDPAIGRFLSVDPVTADGNTGASFNRYWYANNNPYSFTDPDGRAGILYWTSPNTVIYTVRYNMHGETPQFTRAQFEAQVKADFSGTVNINGRTVTITAQALPSNGSGPLVNNVNVVRDTAGVTPSGRSETNKIGGNQVTLGATGREAASAATASHEVGGHGGGAGDQYAHGVDVNGNRLQSDVPGRSNVMKDLKGNPANQQTLKEILRAPTNLNGCANGVHAATGGC